MATELTLDPEKLARIQAAVGNRGTVQGQVAAANRIGLSYNADDQPQNRAVYGPLPPLVIQPVARIEAQVIEPPTFGESTVALLQTSWPALAGAAVIFSIAGFAIGYSWNKP